MNIMGDGSIQPIIQPVTIDTMLNNNGLNNRHGLKKTLNVNKPEKTKVFLFSKAKGTLSPSCNEQKRIQKEAACSK